MSKPKDHHQRELAEFLAKRDALFRNPTTAAALTFGPPPPGGWIDRQFGPLAAVHKARLQWLDATDEMLAESVQWLTDHDYQTTQHGAPPLTPERRDADRAALGKPPLSKRS
jgi:hypothetical protein